MQRYFSSKHPDIAAREAGDKARDVKHWGLAVQNYERHLSDDPNDAAIWIQLGHALSESGRFEKADRAYRTAVAIMPGDADLLICWGHSRKRAGDVRGARRLYDRSLAVDGNADAAECLRSLPQADEAVAQHVEIRDQDQAKLLERFDPAAPPVLSLESPRGEKQTPSRSSWLRGGALANGTTSDISLMIRAYATENDSETTETFPSPSQDLEGALSASQSDDRRPVAATHEPDVVVKRYRDTMQSGEIALLAASTSTGALAPQVRPLIELLRGQRISVLLLVETVRPVHVRPEILDAVDGLLIRRVGGGAFPSWARAAGLYPELYWSDILWLMTGDLVPATKTDRFGSLIAAIRASNAGLIGLTESMQHGWHIQHQFMAAKNSLLNSGRLRRLFDDLGEPEHDRHFSRKLCEHADEAPVAVEAMFNSPFARDALSDGWSGLIAAGCPFIDVRCIANDPVGQERFDSSDPRLTAAGFDPDLLDAVRHAETDGITGNRDDRLYAHPLPTDDPSDRPLDVALVGNGTGSSGDASTYRTLASVIRRRGARLNLFAGGGAIVDRSSVAPLTTHIEFQGRPDILLLPIVAGVDPFAVGEKDDRIARATRRIGVWLGRRRAELPPLATLDAFDRIWAIDEQAAAELRGVLELEVDIVPFPLFDDAIDFQDASKAAGLAWDEAASAADALLRLALRERVFPRWPRVAPFVIPRDAGVPLEDAPLADHIRTLPLTTDGAPRIDLARQLKNLRRFDGWVVIAPRGTRIRPDLAAVIDASARERPLVDIFYGDDAAAEANEPVDQLRLKPEFDITLLASQDYIGAFLIVRAAALEALGGLDRDHGTAAVADLLFRAHHHGLIIARIADVLLLHPGRRVRPNAFEYGRMLRAQPQLERYEIKSGCNGDSFELRRRFARANTPEITLIIPTMRATASLAAPSHIERLLSDLGKTDWPMSRLKVLVGDDIPGRPEWADADHPFEFEWLGTPRGAGEAFNYAAKMNHLWRAASTEQLVFMNDDIRSPNRDWLKALQTFALESDVGGVGCRLLFPDGRLQHAGLMPYREGAAHAWVHRRRRSGTYQGWSETHRQWSMVTGAVFATRRSVMDHVGGFDERFQLEYNDSDLCLRLRDLGYRIIYTPHAEMVHDEKASRGDAPPPAADTARFLNRWSGWLDADPSWHPGLDRNYTEVMPKIPTDAWYR